MFIVLFLILFGLYFGAGMGKAKPKPQPAKVASTVTTYHTSTTSALPVAGSKGRKSGSGKKGKRK